MYIDSLWGNDFEVENNDSVVLDKISSPKTSNKKSSKLSLQEKLDDIKKNVYSVLGQHKEDTLVIKDRVSFSHYIDSAIRNGYIAIDTETNNSTDPLTCEIMGACLYTPSEKQVYIPINHVDLYSNERLSWQLTEKDLKEEFQRLIDNDVKIIFHNASFDIRVIQCTCGIVLTAYWDTSLACKVLNNIEEASLKKQYVLHIDKNHGKYNIENLFEKEQYSIINPELFALYAATDSMMTYKLYEYQLREFSKEGNQRLFKLFLDVEMPEVKVVKNMLLRGITIDEEYWQRLKSKYDNQLSDVTERLNTEISNLKDTIAKWRLTKDANLKTKKVNAKGVESYTKSKSEQLEEVPNLASSTQLGILLYDVLRVPCVNKDKPRSTDEETLKLIYEQTHLNICGLILELRSCLKLLSTYIDNIPPLLNMWNDGKVRTGFNQYGTDTGRFSSGGKIKYYDEKTNKKVEIPLINLQTIPSHNKEIRMLYSGSPGYVIVGSDYSAQEPRLTAFMSRDKNMLQAYKDGKDLYAVIASMSFGVPYESCLEFNPITGEKQVDGKERRSQAKSILLGLTYGRGIASIAEQINKTKKEAQEILDKFFTAFPQVKQWIDSVNKKAHETGYVEDWYGRRRQLPNILLPKYVVEPITSNTQSDFNPFIECENRVDEKLTKKIKNYYKELESVKWNSELKEIQEKALKDNIKITCNSNKIAEAERQSVNAIIQGGAATLTKLAMINIDNDEELNSLGFRLLSTIHDEVFGECPEENAEKVASRLTQVMIDTAKPYMDVPMSCDPYIVSHWYMDEYKAEIIKEFSKLLEDNLTREQALDKIYMRHTECTHEFLNDCVKEI